MSALRLTGRRVAAFAILWMVGLPTALVVRIVGASQTGGGHGIDIAKLYTFRTLALWAGPPLLLLALWERTRGQMTTGSAAG